MYMCVCVCTCARMYVLDTELATSCKLLIMNTLSVADFQLIVLLNVRTIVYLAEGESRSCMYSLLTTQPFISHQ